MPNPPSATLGEVSPFGGTASHLRTLSTDVVAEMYREKCGVDISQFFAGVTSMHLFECGATGMRFWRPSDVAGPEEFYKVLSKAWPNYYKTDRWEYANARRAIGTGKRVLEVGCGRAFFLASIEGNRNECIGIELNEGAIANKVAKAEIRKAFVQDLAAKEPASFDVVCSFQVLEHVTEPALFVRSCVELVRPDGLIILSVPNYDFELHRAMKDAFDLPPHHVNHFTADTFKRIADLLGLDLVEVQTEQLEAPRKRIAIDASASGLYKGLGRIANFALKRIMGTEKVPGHTLIAILRKKSDKA